MCGIAGYVGERDAVPNILDALDQLQYRGYDSSGIALVTPSGALECYRALGSVSVMRSQVAVAPDALLGIGHTRWATHGKPSLENTHPFLSCDGRLAIVHNGVITNYVALRQDLEAAGHRFTSQTDSEVVAHLVEEEVRHGASVPNAFSSLPEKLEGSFAIAAVAQGCDEVFLTRRSSPLVIGIGKGEYFPASDIPSFLNQTSRVVYLGEDDCVAVGPSGIHRIGEGRAGSSSIGKSFETAIVDLSPESYTKGDFDHFMIKEICEQARIIEVLAEPPPAPLDKLVVELRKASRVFVAGIGTSYHSALYIDRLGSHLAIQNLRAVVSSEMDQYSSLVDSKTVVIVLSQSGETADTITAAKIALERGAQVWGILNVPTSTIGRMCHGVIPISCGPELAVAATKSYTAQLAILVGLVERWVYNGAEAFRLLKDAAGSAYDLTSTSLREHVKTLANRLSKETDIFLLGRGLQNVTAREAALKLKEVAGIRAEAFYMGEMKHGPFALIREGTPVIVFYGMAEKSSAEVAAMELSSRGAHIFTVGPEPLPASQWHIRTSELGPGLPLTQIIPAQILSYDIAAMKRMDPDRPPNLAKSVTVL